jgi:hypothetical protein
VVEISRVWASESSSPWACSILAISTAYRCCGIISVAKVTSAGLKPPAETVLVGVTTGVNSPMPEMDPFPRRRSGAALRRGRVLLGLVASSAW